MKQLLRHSGTFCVVILWTLLASQQFFFLDKTVQ